MVDENSAFMTGPVKGSNPVSLPGCTPAMPDRFGYESTIILRSVMGEKYSIELGGFTIVPDKIVKDLGLVTAAVFGKVWRYSQMNEGVCRAGLGRLGEELSLDQYTVKLHLKKLLDAGYIIDTSPTFRNRPHIYRVTDKLKLSLAVIENPVPENLVPENAAVLPQNTRVLPQNPLPCSRESRVEETLLRDNIKKREEEETTSFSSPTGILFDHTSWEMKAQSLYRQVTGQVSIPASRVTQTLTDLQSVMDHYGSNWERAVEEGKEVFGTWCNTNRKAGGTYSKTNTAWMDKWLEKIAPQPTDPHEDSFQALLKKARIEQEAMLQR